MQHAGCEDTTELAIVAARLLDGAGIATLSVHGSSRPEDVVVTLDHQRGFVGQVVVDCLPAPGSQLRDPAVAGTRVILAVDEYAPLPQVRVLTASVHLRGVVSRVATNHVSAVRVTIEITDVAVSRFGECGVIDAQQIDEAPRDLLAEQAFDVAQELMTRFDTVLSTLAGATCDSALIIGVSRRGLHLMTRQGKQARLSRIDFGEPAHSTDDVVAQLTLLMHTVAA
ncbi:hypothetical protein [Enemella sp. A6]|uniref:hypothetical protein n=1 Tax=Enemella sp. A6 TaxID=3440152 RepID=UPI003EB884DA